MDDLSLGLIGFTAFSLIAGFVLGLIRGCNRSILRIVLIIACAVAALFLKDIISNAIMGLEIEGKTVPQLLQESFAQEGQEMPESLVNFITQLATLLIGIVAYFITFFVLQGASWIIIFPIMKLIIRKGKKKRALIGGVVGLVQGLVIAFVVCVPMTGLLIQVDKISALMEDMPTEQAQVADEKLIAAMSVEEGGEEGGDMGQMPEMPFGNFNLSEFTSSPVCKAYYSLGGWYFDIVSTVKDSEGKELKLSTVTDVLKTIVSISTDVIELEESIKELTNPEADPEESLSSLGEILIDVGQNIENLDTDGEELLDTLLDGVKEWLVPEDDPEVSEEVQQAFENLTVENLNLTSVGEAFVALSHYTNKVEDPEVEVHITQEDANAIVHGISDNPFIMDMIGETVIMEIDEEDAETFTSAIENIADISAEDKAALYKMFNLA